MVSHLFLESEKMSDTRGRTRRAKGGQSKTFKVEGTLKPAEWAELFEKLKALLKQYGVTLKKVGK